MGKKNDIGYHFDNSCNYKNKDINMIPVISVTGIAVDSVAIVDSTTSIIIGYQS